MNDIPDEAVDAAAETMAEMWNQRLSEEDAPYTPSDFTFDARDILTAAAPFIRAEVAREIREWRATAADVEACMVYEPDTCLICRGREQAAQIAEGEHHE